LNGRKFLVHSIQSDPDIEWIKPTLPIARFDKLTNAAIVRRECIEDYAWDERFPQGEHLDFYLGHYHFTSWNFAVCPTVIFDHQKDRYPIYREKVRSSGENYNEKKNRTEKLYARKWGYDRIEYGSRPDWIDTSQKSTFECIYRIIDRHVPTKYILPFKDIIEIIR